MVKSAGIKLLRAGTSAVNNIIDGKPVGDAVESSLMNLNRKNRRRQANVPKKRNKKRRRQDTNVISNKRRRSKHDIFS